MVMYDPQHSSFHRPRCYKVHRAFFLWMQPTIPEMLRDCKVQRKWQSCPYILIDNKQCGSNSRCRFCYLYWTKTCYAHIDFWLLRCQSDASGCVPCSPHQIIPWQICSIRTPQGCHEFHNIIQHSCKGATISTISSNKGAKCHQHYSPDTQCSVCLSSTWIINSAANSDSD